MNPRLYRNYITPFRHLGDFNTHSTQNPSLVMNLHIGKTDASQLSVQGRSQLQYITQIGVLHRTTGIAL
jgi:hypothetical protein